MKKLIGGLAVVATTLALVIPSSANASRYGTAGCGLGSLAFGPKPGIIQTVAATLNYSFGSQMFGITSGTSNCKSNGVIKAELEQQAFVAYNFDALKQDIAKGNGETVGSLAHLMGCSAANTTEFGTMAKAGYSEIYKGKEGQEADWVLYRIKQSVVKNASLKQSCSKIWM